MAQLWKSFMEALALPHGELQRGEGVALNRMVSGCPLSHHEQPNSHTEGPGSRAPPEYQEVICSDLNVNLARESQGSRVEEDELDSDVEFQDSREVLPTRSLADSIAAPRLTHATFETNMNNQPSSSRLESHINQTAESGESLQVLNSESGAGAISTANLIEDAKFYQDAALEYQDACETLCQELQHWFTQQVQLVQEASEALQAVEVKSSIRQQEYVALQGKWEAEIWRAIDKAVIQYQDQLSSTQSSLQWKDKEHQQSIQKLQDQVRALELSLAGQATLSSVVPSLSRPGLCQKVFNILLGTVNSRRGAAQYESQDQAFSFHKQVRFEDNDSSPKLRPDVKSGGGRSAQALPVIAPRLSDISTILHVPKYIYTPHQTILSDRTFDVSPAAPLVNDSRNAATIAAEVSAAAAVQASKELHRM